MAIPVNEDSYNNVAKYSKELANFVSNLKNDNDVITALKSIPNIKEFANDEDSSYILIAMSIQDIINGLDALFGEVSFNTAGSVGLYIFFNHINGNESSYDTYMKLAFGITGSDLSNSINYFRNWGLNATSSEYKLAILLSNINDVYLKEYWKFIFQFFLSVLNAERKLLNTKITEEQQAYLNDIENRARNYFKAPSLSFAPTESTNSVEFDMMALTPYMSYQQDGNVTKLTISKNKLVNYTIDTLTSNDSKKDQLVAKMLRKSSLAVNILYQHPRNYFSRSFVLDQKIGIAKGDTIYVFQCKYNGDLYSLKQIEFPLVIVKASNAGALVLPFIHSNEIEEDIELEIINNNTDGTVCYEKYFNIYDYRNINSEILKKVEPYSDCINVSLQWDCPNGTYITKNTYLGTLRINSFNIEENFYSLSDGYLFLKTKSFNEDINKWNFLFSDHDSFCQNDLLFCMYPTKKDWLEDKYNKFDLIEDKDIFTEDRKLHWNVVANRYIDSWEIQGLNSFEMTSESNINIFVSFEYYEDSAHLILGIHSRDVQLRNGDTFSILLEKEDNKKILDFTIVDQPTKIDESENNGMYDTIYSFALYFEDLEYLQSHYCTNWRITFFNNRKLPITGLNESEWTPSSIACDVFMKFAKSFCDELNLRNIEVIHNKANIQIASNSTIPSDSCYVYLMHDTTNGFYKIGISNNPEYRERTLQSEKPTIEMICCKEYPIRPIAEAFEAALHKTFAKKRIRGEWFSLTESDVLVLIQTLS